MYKVGLIFFIIAFTVTNGQHLGLGGVIGNLTPRTGSSWPPYPGAGRPRPWANRAGLYNGRSKHNSRRTKGHRLGGGGGLGGVVGNLTPRTGSSWPPYPGAGRPLPWANRAGLYNGRSKHNSRRTKANRLGGGGGLGGVVGNLTPR